MVLFLFFTFILWLVYSAIATSSFIGNNKRAELFEITDYNVPSINITLPNEEFEELKEIARIGYCYYFKDGTRKPYIAEIASFNFTQEERAIVNQYDKSYDPYAQLPYETKNAAMTFEINGYEYIQKFYFFFFKFI